MKITNKKLEKPNFLIAGAPRSGTGYVYHILDVHPDIYMAKPEKPEPKFFLVDEEYNKGIEYYLEKYFSNVVGKKAIGEKARSIGFLNKKMIFISGKCLLILSGTNSFSM